MVGGGPPDFPTSALPDGEFERKFTNELLEFYSCNVSKVVEHVMAPTNRRVHHIRSEGKNDGGFGAQMILKIIPRAVSAVLMGRRMTMDLSTQPWNYGCPGHETAADVLASVVRAEREDTVLRSKNRGDMCGAGTVELDSPLACRGKVVPLSAVRNATADFLFTLAPYFADAVASRVASLELPPRVLAVHLRGGDKLVMEWAGPMAKMGSAKHWAGAALEALRFEREHFTPDLGTIFLESDDCKLMLATEKHIVDLSAAGGGGAVSVVHFPCEIRAPTVYRAKGHAANVTGHDQSFFNAGHSCEDTVRYFAGLTVFRDADATLLGPGGVKGGVPMSPARLSSNTVMFIELIRRGRKKQPLGREYHTGKGNGNDLIHEYPLVP